MKNEVVIMPNCSECSYEKCLDILQNTRDIAIYLDALFAIRYRSLIVLSVKDTPGNKMADEVFNKVKSIGFLQLTKELWRTYIGIIDRGNILYDSSSERADLPLELSMDISGQMLYVLSQPRGIGRAVISINDADYCISGRGWNIVVFDFESNTVIDSATYDGHAAKPTLYHKMLEFDKQYFDDHFFVMEKYKKDWIARYQKSYFSNRRLNHKEIYNGIIEPVKVINGKGYGGVCDERFNFIAGHVKYFANGNDCSESYRADEADIDYIDETVIYGGALMNHPGHLIIDSGAEYLWWVLQNKELEYRIAVTSTPIIFVNEHPFKFIIEFLEAMNLPLSRFIFVEKPTKFKKIIVPDQSNYLLEWSIVYEYTREFASVFENIRKNVTPGNKKKLYLTKTKTVKKNTIGEDFFVEFYKNKGFEIIDPEDYTLKEKAELMLGADEVVSVLGTNTHFAIFCRPDVKLTVLTRFNASHIPSQPLINQVAGIKNATFVNAGLGFFHTDYAWGITLLCVTYEFKEYIRKVYHEEIDITPEESLKGVLFEYLKYIPEYYSDPQYYNKIKNQKMLKMLQNMSEVFLGKEFSTSILDLKTEEDMLREQVKKLTADLASSKKRITDLEGAVVYNAAKLLEATNGRLEKQIDELKKTQEQLIENDKLVKKDFDEFLKKMVKTELENLNLKSENSLLEKQNDELKKTQEELLKNDKLAKKDFDDLLEKMLTAELENSNLKSDNSLLKEHTSKLQNQIAVYEQSRSWKFTKPLRAIARFLRRLFGKSIQ